LSDKITFQQFQKKSNLIYFNSTSKSCDKPQVWGSRKCCSGFVLLS